MVKQMTNQNKFLHKLTLALNYKTVEELKNTMSHLELQSWYEYYQEEPFGYDRIEIQLATITDILLKSNGVKESSPIDHMVSISNDIKQYQKEKQKKSDLMTKLNNF